MMRVFFLITIIFMSYKSSLSQDVQPQKICYDKDLIKTLALECEVRAEFKTKKNLTINSDTNKDKYSFSFPNNKKLLTIKVTDGEDNGKEAYYANDVVSNNKKLCSYDMLRSNEKSKHKGEFRFGDQTETVMLSSTVTPQTTIPKITVENPNEFTVNVHYRFEALPLKELTVTTNGQTTKFNNKCTAPPTDTEVDCLEYDGKLQITNKPPNNKIDLDLAYTLDDWLSCGLTTLDPFKYAFTIEYAPDGLSIISNLNKSDNGNHLARKGAIALFTVSVLYANPTANGYFCNLVQTFEDDTEEVTQLTAATEGGNVFIVEFKEVFKSAKLNCFARNQIGNSKSIKISIEYYEEPSTTPKSELVIGIIIGSISSLIVIIPFCLFIIFKCKNSSSQEARGIEGDKPPTGYVNDRNKNTNADGFYTIPEHQKTDDHVYSTTTTVF